MKTEGEKWEELMDSSREMCHQLGQEFKAPQYQNWLKGRAYLDELRAAVQFKAGKCSVGRCVTHGIVYGGGGVPPMFPQDHCPECRKPF